MHEINVYIIYVKLRKLRKTKLYYSNLTSLNNSLSKIWKILNKL